MAWLIVQRFPDLRMGRYYAETAHGDPTWDATVTAEAMKFETYAQALAVRDGLPDVMRHSGIRAVIEPCRNPIHGVK